MSPQLNISAGELFELIRPAGLILSALLSTWVFASAWKRFPLYVALLWALATLFLPPIVLPLYVITLLMRRGKASRSQPRWRIAAPLIYAGVVIGSICLYLYAENRGVDVHLARAAHAKVRGNRTTTIAEYRAALREEDDPHTHKLLAIELSGAGYWTEALSEFRLAERGGEPDDLMAFRIGSLLNALNLPNQANLEYQKFLASGMCFEGLPDVRCEAAKQHLADSNRSLR